MSNWFIRTIPSMKAIPFSRFALALAALTLGGCAPTESAAHPTDGVWGYVAAAKNAQLEVSGDATTRELLVDRVVAPGDAWIVAAVASIVPAISSRVSSISRRIASGFSATARPP